MTTTDLDYVAAQLRIAADAIARAFCAMDRIMTDNTHGQPPFALVPLKESKNWCMLGDADSFAAQEESNNDPGMAANRPSPDRGNI